MGAPCDTNDQSCRADLRNQLGRAALLPRAFLGAHVGVVLGERPEGKVLDSNAALIVASMHYAKARRNGPSGQLPGDPMRTTWHLLGHSSGLDLSVAHLPQVACPDPAWTNFGSMLRDGALLVYLVAKSLFEWPYSTAVCSAVPPVMAVAKRFGWCRRSTAPAGALSHQCNSTRRPRWESA